MMREAPRPRPNPRHEWRQLPRRERLRRRTKTIVRDYWWVWLLMAALGTGLVYATEHWGNGKTFPDTLSVTNADDPHGHSAMVHVVTPTFSTHYEDWGMGFSYACPSVGGNLRVRLVLKDSPQGFGAVPLDNLPATLHDAMIKSPGQRFDHVYHPGQLGDLVLDLRIPQACRWKLSVPPATGQ